ncbi:MAG TPA: type II toxin-antitoxin system VapC family toxin [Chthoniobacteraceae bacterium]|nr:type II toxin-antitoxin system VapC family toxin [Chthoniobacteraceae bacterium]
MPDTNVLLNAVNPTAEHHDKCRAWLADRCTAGEPIGWAWVALLGFVRISTRKVVFSTPLSVGEAMDYVSEWLGLTNSRVLHPGLVHASEMRRLLLSSGTAGNLVTDAHLAALAIEHGAELCSCDSDFGRFPGLRWFNPATGSRTRP